MADVGEIRARLVLSSDDFNRGMTQARGQMEQTNRTAERTSKAIDKIHKASAVFAGAVGAVFAASIVTAANFEQKMKDVQAVSGESADNMQKLKDLAIDMGNKTAFSAAEAASGIEELVKAGVSVTEILNGGLEGALNLAVAGNINLADAAEIASTALNSFKKDGLSVAQAADLLAGAANASATDVEELKYGLSAVSAVASGVGLSFKDTTTALAVFAQNGLKGSDAGTSLKSMLLNLSPSTKQASEEMKKLGLETKNGNSIFYDSQGHIKSLADISEILHTKLGKLTDEQRQMALKTIFGTDAIRAANILYKEGAKGVSEMYGEMSKVKAIDVAKTKMDTLKGAFDNFKSSLETAGIKIGDSMLPVLTDLVRKATDLIGTFDDVKLANLESALAFGGTAAAIAFVGTKIVTLVRTASTLFTTMGPTGWLIVGISLLAGVIAQAVVQHNLLDDAMLKNLKSRYDSAKSLDAEIKQYDDLRSQSKLTNDEFHRYVDLQGKIKQTTDPKVLAGLTTEADKLQEKSGLSNEKMQKMVELNGDLVKKVPEATKVITDQGHAVIDNTKALKEYSAAKLDSLYKDLDLQRISTETKYKDLLKEEHDLIKKIKDDNEHLEQLKKDRESAQKKANEEASKLKDMMKDTSSYSQAELQTQVEKNAAAQTALGTLQKHLEKQSDLVQQDAKDLDSTQKKLQAVKGVRDEMSQIVLQQVGLNSKTGEEVKTIDAAIGKLQAQKAELEKTTPVAQRNTAEYHDAVTAIDNQIGRLQTARSKVQDITHDADAMNDALAKPINKTVNVSENVKVTATGTLKLSAADLRLIDPQGKGPVNKGNPYKLSASDLRLMGGQFHTGGITGRGQLPMLHVGGLASQFASLPNHNEVDVRLLRNEMVLTESQQANLMRMIDAGFTKSNQSPMDNNEILSVLDEIRRNTSKGLDTTVVMDSYMVGKLVEPHVTDAQNTKQQRKEGFS